MAREAIKHGSEAGYREELKTDTVCERCRRGHRVYDSQYGRQAKAKGIKYGRYDVLDSHYVPGKARGAAATREVRLGSPDPRPSQARPGGPESHPAGPDQSSASEETGPEDRPSLADRLSSGLRGIAQQWSGNDYVEDSDAPDYIKPEEPDPEPNDGFSRVRDDEFVVTAETIKVMEGNLASYLSMVGMPLEIFDPYCGQVLANNLDAIVSRWTRVVSHYPNSWIAKTLIEGRAGTLGDWIGAISATWPVALAIYEHHLSKSVQVDRQGRIFRVSPSANGYNVDATMPPMPDYEYTVN